MAFPLDLLPQIFTELPELGDMLNMFLVCREWTEKIRKWTSRAAIQALFTTHPAIPRLFRNVWVKMNQEDVTIERDNRVVHFYHPDWPWYRYLALMKIVYQGDRYHYPPRFFELAPPVFALEICLQQLEEMPIAVHRDTIYRLGSTRGKAGVFIDEMPDEVAQEAYDAFLWDVMVVGRSPRDEKERKQHERITRTIVARYLLVKTLSPFLFMRKCRIGEGTIDDLFLPRDAWPAAIELLRFGRDRSVYTQWRTHRSDFFFSVGSPAAVSFVKKLLQRRVNLEEADIPVLWTLLQLLAMSDYPPMASVLFGLPVRPCDFGQFVLLFNPPSDLSPSWREILTRLAHLYNSDNQK
jgi:hypothetical protein